MSSLILIRHAMPALDRAVPAHMWELDDVARESSRRLALCLPPDPLIVSSTETKACQTAEEIHAVCGGGIRSDERLVEVVRGESWLDDHRCIAAEYVGGIQQPGWEAQDAVASRFGAVIRELCEESDDTVVVVTHGQAMSTWLAAEGLLNDVVAFWSALTFPDAWGLRGDLGDTWHDLRRLGARGQSTTTRT